MIYAKAVTSGHRGKNWVTRAAIAPRAGAALGCRGRCPASPPAHRTSEPEEARHRRASRNLARPASCPAPSPKALDSCNEPNTEGALPIPKVLQDRCAQNHQSTRTGDTPCDAVRRRVPRGLHNPRKPPGPLRTPPPDGGPNTDSIHRDAHQVRLSMRLGPIAGVLARAGSRCGSWLKAF